MITSYDDYAAQSNFETSKPKQIIIGPDSKFIQNYLCKCCDFKCLGYNVDHNVRRLRHQIFFDAGKHIIYIYMYKYLTHATRLL